MTMYEETVMAEIGKLEEKLDEEMDTTEETPTPTTPTTKKPEEKKGLMNTVKSAFGINWEPTELIWTKHVGRSTIISSPIIWI